MSRTTKSISPVVRTVRSNLFTDPQEEVIDVTSTPPDYEESVFSLGGSLLLDSKCEEENKFNSSPVLSSSPIFFSPKFHVPIEETEDTDDVVMQETHGSNTSPNTIPDQQYLEQGQLVECSDKCYSQSISSMLLNLDAINSQEIRNTNPTGILERSLSINPKESIITEVLNQSDGNKTTTIRHVLECRSRVHRILAKLVDVYPKELSKIIDTGSYGLTLVLKDKSECTLRAKIRGPLGTQQFFDHFRSDTTRTGQQLVQIGALFEYIIGKFPLFEDYVIHEDRIPENTFLLDLSISSTGDEDEPFEILNSRLNRHFMVDFCWYLLNSNEDILKDL